MQSHHRGLAAGIQALSGGADLGRWGRPALERAGQYEHEPSVGKQAPTPVRHYAGLELTKVTPAGLSRNSLTMVLNVKNLL
jgi:hypothetical protein